MGLELRLGQRDEATYYILRRISPLKYENHAPMLHCAKLQHSRRPGHGENIDGGGEIYILCGIK